MMDFVRTELVRLRGWSALVALVHLVALAFASRLVDLGQASPVVHQAIAGAYFLLGFLLGLYQIGSYRRPSTWLNLLHRPVSGASIAAALLLAGGLLLAAMLLLSLLAVVCWQAAATARVVDLRHFLLALAGTQLGVIGYLNGVYVMLRGRRHAIVVLATVVLLATMRWSGVAALSFQWALAAWLVASAIAAFRPDPLAPARGAVATIVSAFPLQVAAYLLLLFGGYVFETAWILQGTHPNNIAVPLPGGHNEVERMEGRDRMAAVLRGSRSPDAALLREQIALSDTYALSPAWPNEPGRHDLTNQADTGFADEASRTAWTFSRDRMRFEGRRTADGRRAGELGRRGGDAFSAVATPAGREGLLDEGDLLLVGGDTLYHFDAQAHRILPRLRLPERILGLAQVGEGLALLGAHAIYFVDGRDIALPDATLAVRQRVVLPAPLDELSRIDIIERVDGPLVALTYSAHAHEVSRTAPFQSLLAVEESGNVTEIAHRRLAYDYPALFRYRSWWPSPALYAAFNLARGALDAPALQPADLPRVPRPVLAAAAMSMLLSMLLATALVRRLPRPAATRAGWILACGLCGLPALTALWLCWPQEYRIPEAPLRRHGAQAVPA